LTVVHKYPIQAFDGTVTLLELMNMLSLISVAEKKENEPKGTEGTL
jgi:hypothetical protein